MRRQSVQGFKGPVGTMNRRIEGVEATFAEHEMKFNFIEKKAFKHGNRRKKRQRQEGTPWMLKDQ